MEDRSKEQILLWEKRHRNEVVYDSSMSLEDKRGSRDESTDSLSLLQQPVTPANAHFCDYATGARVLAANHKNDTGRC